MNPRWLVRPARQATWAGARALQLAVLHLAVARACADDLQLAAAGEIAHPLEQRIQLLPNAPTITLSYSVDPSRELPVVLKVFIKPVEVRQVIYRAQQELWQAAGVHQVDLNGEWLTRDNNSRSTYTLKAFLVNATWQKWRDRTAHMERLLEIVYPRALEEVTSTVDRMTATSTPSSAVSSETGNPPSGSRSQSMLPQQASTTQATPRTLCSGDVPFHYVGCDTYPISAMMWTAVEIGGVGTQLDYEWLLAWCSTYIYPQYTILGLIPGSQLCFGNNASSPSELQLGLGNCSEGNGQNGVALGNRIQIYVLCVPERTRVSEEARCQCGHNEVCNRNQTCACRSGFVRDIVSGECANLDECADIHAPPCNSTYTCVDTEGSYSCICEGVMSATGNQHVDCISDDLASTSSPKTAASKTMSLLSNYTVAFYILLATVVVGSGCFWHIYRSQASRIKLYKAQFTGFEYDEIYDRSGNTQRGRSLLEDEAISLVARIQKEQKQRALQASTVRTYDHLTPSDFDIYDSKETSDQHLSRIHNVCISASTANQSCHSLCRRSSVVLSEMQEGYELASSDKIVFKEASNQGSPGLNANCSASTMMYDNCEA